MSVLYAEKIFCFSLIKNSSFVKSLAIYIPSEEEIKCFNSVVNCIFDKIAANVKENKTLEQVRDALLPKLMSGEIDVSKVDISDPGCLDKSLFSGE